MFLQQQCSSTTDQRCCHGGTAHADIVAVHQVLAAAPRQGKIIIGGKNGNDIIPRCPEIRREKIFPGETGKRGGLKKIPVFPCPYGNDTAADCRRGTVSSLSVGVPGGSHHDDAHLPQLFHGFLQGQVHLSVVGADGKIHYSDIIFAKIVHYPSQGPYRLLRISLTGPIQDFDGNDIHFRGDTAINAVGKGAVSAGDTRDVGHGCEEYIDFLAFYCCLR